MRRKRFFFNNGISTSIDGIEDILFEGIVMSYQNNNQDILVETISLISDVLYSSVEKKSILIFERNLLLMKNLYPISLTNGKYSAYVKNTSIRIIRSTVSSILYRVEQKVDKGSEEILVKQFLKYALTIYSQILHDILLAKDYETYKNAIEEFYSYIFKKYAYPDLHKSKDELSYEIEYYINSIAILQYSWIIYLYKNKKLTESECLNVLSSNRFASTNYEKILDTLIYISGISSFDVFGSENWEEDIEKRKTNIAYSPIQPIYWTALGMMLFFIKNPSLVNKELNEKRIRSSRKYFKMYFDDFQNVLSEIRRNREIWIPIIFSNTLSDVTTNSNHEEEFLKNIETVSESLKRAAFKLIKIEFVNNNTELVSKPFSEAKIIEYKEAVGAQWYNRSFLHKLFDYYGNFNVIDDNATIEPIGAFIYQQNMKTMFVDDGYNFVYGSTDFGGRIADFEDGTFLNSIKTDDKPIRQFNNIIECLNTLIDNVISNGFIPTVIIMNHHWQYSTNDLIDNSDFVPDWKIENNSGEDNSRFSLYKDIPVYTSFNSEFEEYIVISNFENAFTLNQVRNDSWFKKQLKVDTIPVDETEAKRQFDLDPNRWTITSEGLELTEEEALTHIKTGVVWDINVREIFEVKNPLAYVIGQIPTQKEDDVVIEINPL